MAEEIDDTEYEMFKAQAMNNPDIMSQVRNMPEGEREEYIRNLFRDYVGEEEILNEQVAQADAMRSAEGPEGRYTKNAYVAANPLEHLNQGIRNVKGELDYQKGMQGKADISADKTAAQVQTGQNMYNALPNDNLVGLDQQAGNAAPMVNRAVDEAARKQLEQAKMLRMYGTPT